MTYRVPVSKEFLHFPGSATMEEVLRAYLDRGAKWFWLLSTERDGQYYVCSFGSLLPYLTGRTPHIVHNIGDCPICSGMDPLLWQDADTLIEEALGDKAIGARRVADLPMAELRTMDAKEYEETGIAFGSVVGLIDNGVLSGFYIERMRDDVGGVPAF